MIWQLPEEAHGRSGSDTVTMRASSVLTGHQARLWDATFAGELVITASEDCTCRFACGTFLLWCLLKRPCSQCGAIRCSLHTWMSCLVLQEACYFCRVNISTK